jgi:hypothetical protein
MAKTGDFLMATDTWPARGICCPSRLASMAEGGEYSLTNVILETPSQSVGAQHDVVGKGKAYVEGGTLHIAIRPRGLAGLIPTSEKRSFPLPGITGWEVTGSKIEFTAGSIGMIATNGANAPLHICGFRCADPQSASQLTDEALAGGLNRDRISRHGS